MKKIAFEYVPDYYDWDFDGQEPEPIYLSSEIAENGARVAVLENITLKSGEKITAKFMPLKVSDSEFMNSLADSSGHESNVSLICHLCVGWGDKDFILPEDINHEVSAVADVGGALAQLFQKRAELVRVKKTSA